MSDLDKLFDNEKTTKYEATSKEDWLIQKEQNRTEAYEILQAVTDELNNPERLMQYLDVQSRFDRYSVSNALLITHQKPEATRLADSKTWQKEKVYINKGEKGILILEPGKEYARKDGSKAFSYNAKKVFDISQTNAKPKSYDNKQYNERALVKALVQNSPVNVEISNELPETIDAIYQPESKMIFVRQGMNGDDIFRNLSREIAYAKLDKGDFDREKLSPSAQSVAYIVCKRMGIEPEKIKSLPDSFAECDVKDKRKELSKIRDCANNLSGAIEKQLEEKNKDHGDR